MKTVHTVGEALRAIRVLTERAHMDSKRAQRAAEDVIQYGFLYQIGDTNRRKEERIVGADGPNVMGFIALRITDAGLIATVRPEHYRDTVEAFPNRDEILFTFTPEVMDSIRSIRDNLKNMPSATKGWGGIGAIRRIASAALGDEESLAHVQRAAGERLDGPACASGDMGSAPGDAYTNFKRSRGY